MPRISKRSDRIGSFDWQDSTAEARTADGKTRRCDPYVGTRRDAPRKLSRSCAHRKLERTSGMSYCARLAFALSRLRGCAGVDTGADGESYGLVGFLGMKNDEKTIQNKNSRRISSSFLYSYVFFVQTMPSSTR